MVKDYQGALTSKKTTNDARHQQLLDSAQYYKSTSIENALDFVAQSISVLGKNPNKRLLARSYTLLGDIYLFHKQYDLAIDNFNDALKISKNIQAKLLLAEALVLINDVEQAEKELEELQSLKKATPEQRIKINELSGDFNANKKEISLALAYYRKGLKIAQKNQLTAAETDLTSKIATTYALADKQIEAQGYYNNSLTLSKKEGSKRAIQESEKVADFYSKNQRFDEEINQRKQSLNTLSAIQKPVKRLKLMKIKRIVLRRKK